MRVAIVEDEAVVARRLERAVRAILDEELTSLVVLDGLPAALAHVRARALDLVFLDLDLSGRDGFGLLAESVAAPFQTIVVSAKDDQALRAFEYGVTDFVAKPWTEKRLARAIERARGRGPAVPSRAARLAVRRGGAVELVDVARVRAIRGAGDYTELVLSDGTTRLHEKTLEQLERLLPERFARAHRSWIVNLDAVESWSPAPGGRATLRMGGAAVPVGRTYRRALLARLDPRAERPDDTG